MVLKQAGILETSNEWASGTSCHWEQLPLSKHIL